MNIFASKTGDEVTVVTLEGSVTVPKTEDLKSFMMQRIESGATEILIDLSKVSYIDSSGISILLNILQAVRKNSGDVRLVGLSDRINGIFRNIGLHHVFRSYKTVDEGLKSFDPSEQSTSI